MKKVLFFLAAVWFSMQSFAQQPDFSGKWVLDKSKSKIDEKTAAILHSQTITAVQTDKAIRITIVTGQPGDTDAGQKKLDLGSGAVKTYTFDGKEFSETRSTSIGEVRVSWKAELISKQLKLTIKHRFNIHEEVTTITTETWVLSEGGTVLTVIRQSETPDGIFSSELLYRKA